MLDQRLSVGQRASLRTNMLMQRAKVRGWMRAYPDLAPQLDDLAFQIDNVIARINRGDGEGELEGMLNFAPAPIGKPRHAPQVAVRPRSPSRNNTQAARQIGKLRAEIAQLNSTVAPARAATAAIYAKAVERAIQQAISSGRAPGARAAAAESDDDKRRTDIVRVRETGRRASAALVRRIEERIATLRRTLTASEIAQLIVASRSDIELRDNFERFVIYTAAAIVGGSAAAIAQNWVGVAIAVMTLRGRWIEYRQLQRKLAEKANKESGRTSGFWSEFESAEFEGLPMRSAPPHSSRALMAEAEALAAFEMAAS
jgi:hypothetical protein